MKSVAIGVHLRRDDVEPLAIAVPAGDVFMSALEVHEDQPLGDRDFLVRVAEVRAQLLERATFIAVRYGFTFRSATEAAAKVATHLDRWRELLEQHRDHVELTLRVTASGPKRPERADFSNGADYMRALHTATRGAAVDPDFRAAADELIAPLCVAHRWLPRDEKSAELAGLIERARFPSLADAGRTLKERCPSIPFLLSAPWPLEVFADADHE
jgi:hypothetical protein